MNLQPPKYTPIVGVKISGKKNYADDGRFGKWTLDAATSLFKQINVINKTDIEKDPTLEIKDPNKIPLKVLYSAACQDETGASVTPDETKGAEAMKALEESKIYKDFSFLSSKNQKLHATLMEQLRKDLKRG
jgi:phosphoserine aminotransferase